MHSNYCTHSILPTVLQWTPTGTFVEFKTKMGSSNIPKRIGIAMIGLGRAGNIHFSNCLANRRVDLRYLVDYDVNKCQALIDVNFLDGTQALSPDQLKIALDDEKVHGVIIATVTSSHEELVVRSLTAGKAVFCEKPLAETYDGTVNCYNLSRKTGCPLFCAFNRRFDPTHCKVRDQVVSGVVGQVQIVKTCSRDAAFPSIEYLKTSPGIFHDSAIHDIDLTMWILGEKPIVVSCFGHAFHKEVAEIDDVDTVAITLKFPSGALALIDLSRHAAYGYDQRLEVFGSKGMMQSKNLSSSAISVSNDKGISDDMLEASFKTRYQDAYKIELDHFLDAVVGGDLKVKEDETLAACRVAQACADSIRSGVPVRLEWT